MRVVVTGAGNVGRHLANALQGRGHEVTLVEQEPEKLDRARQEAEAGLELILGDACEPWVLDKADLRTCDVLVTATGDDEDNLVTSLLAKQEYAVPRVISRVNHPENEWLFDAQWGVDVPMSPPHLFTALVEEAVSSGDLVRLLKLEGGRVTLVEVTLDDASMMAGRPLYEVRLPPDAAIMCILREGHVVIPQPETRLASGDEVMAIATPQVEEQIRTALTG